MKRVLLAIIFFILTIFNAHATDWTLTPSLVYKARHYVLWKVICTSNESSLSATDLVALMPANLKTLIQGSTLMVMKVSPGLLTVAPNTTINVTLSDSQSTTIFTHDTYSNTADTTGILMSEDYGSYPTIYEKLYLTLNDIGDSGDQVTLYFENWIE